MSKLNFKNTAAKTVTLFFAALSLMNTACTKEELGLVNKNVNGSVVGLVGTLVLEDNNGDQVTVTEDGTFSFPSEVEMTDHYEVSVVQQPAAQTCTVQNASGVVAMSHVNQIYVFCSANSYFIGVSVTGLTGTLQILNNGTDVTTITADGNYVFPTFMAEGGAYNVTILNQPAGQTCVVSNSSGFATDDVTDISISCSP